jgi:hypothetical protein
MEEQWLDNVLRMLPLELKVAHDQVLEALSQEMRDDYHMSVKKSIGKNFKLSRT